MKAIYALSVALCLPALSAQAQDRPPPPPRIEAALAKQAVEAAIAQCNSEGLNVSSAVVDAGGNPIFVYVPDGVYNVTGDIAIRKGLTMMITGKKASETRNLLETDPAIKEKIDANPRSIPYPGGTPLTKDGQIVGAISVSGATGAHDEACAIAGAEAIGAY